MDHNATLAEIPEELKRNDLVMNILKNGQWGSFRHVPGKFKKTQYQVLVEDIISL